MIKALLLDIDGTLLDSNDLHARAWVEALKDAGFDIPLEHVRPLIGMGSDNLLPALLGTEAGDPLADELAKYRGELFRDKYLHRVRPFQGTRQLLKRLKSKGYQLVAATSASKKDLDQLLRQGKIASLLPLRVNGDDVTNSKPDPDIVLAALKKAKVRKDQALMVGDTPYDITAATRAGVDAIAFTCGGWKADDLIEAKEIYKNPKDMLKSFEGARDYLLGQSHYID